MPRILSEWRSRLVSCLSRRTPPCFRHRRAASAALASTSHLLRCGRAPPTLMVGAKSPPSDTLASVSPLSRRLSEARRASYSAVSTWKPLSPRYCWSRLRPLFLHGILLQSLIAEVDRNCDSTAACCVRSVNKRVYRQESNSEMAL